MKHSDISLDRSRTAAALLLLVTWLGFWSPSVGFARGVSHEEARALPLSLAMVRLQGIEVLTEHGQQSHKLERSLSQLEGELKQRLSMLSTEQRLCAQQGLEQAQRWHRFAEQADRFAWDALAMDELKTYELEVERTSLALATARQYLESSRACVWSTPQARVQLQLGNNDGPYPLRVSLLPIELLPKQH